jgi:hypothetical protein
MRTTNEGRSYTRVGPTGLVWEDLTFTDARHGIGIATPASSAVQGFAAPAALSPANSCVYVTNDGGASYQPVSIVSAVRCGLPSTYGVRCKASQLRLALGPEVSEATEQNTLILLVRNIAETGCDLRGYPRIALLDKHGATLPFAYRRSGDQMLTSRPPTLVPLAPYYGDAYLGVNKNTCEAGDHGIATQIRVTLPGQRHTLRLRLGRYPIMGYCTIQPGHTVDLTPVEPTGAATGYRH